MTDGPGLYAHLEFNAPLGDSRADRLATELAATNARDVLDVGCGWGELLLRILAKAPGARGRGFDVDGRLLERARANAEERGLADRVSFTEAEAGLAEPADVVLCVGSAHAFGEDVARALSALRDLVRPGGRLLLGQEFLEQPPSEVERATAGEVFTDESLADLVDMAVAAGFRPLRIEVASRDELDAFESGFLADWEHWLVEHPDDPRASEIRVQADTHRSRWLRGYRNWFGFAYLTLG